jgi:hypothetical protein
MLIWASKSYALELATWVDNKHSDPLFSPKMSRCLNQPPLVFKLEKCFRYKINAKHDF